MPDDKKKSDVILEELKKRRERGKTVEFEEEVVKLMVFSIRGDYYAFYGDDVKEILPLVNIYYVPGTPDYILGVINVRGDIESVVDINKFLAVPESKTTQYSRIAIAAKNNTRSGILVDSVEDVLDIPASSINPPISTLNESSREIVLGETTYRNRNVTLLDLGAIFRKIAV